MARSGSAVTRRVRVRINPIRCVAFGYCAEFCPEVFALDDWGYAAIVRNDVSDDLLEILTQTANLCPTEAISIEPIVVPTITDGGTHDQRPNTRAGARATKRGSLS
jgi:ferredoxin